MLARDLGAEYSAVRAATRGRAKGTESEGKCLLFSSARKMMSWAVPLPAAGASQQKRRPARAVFCFLYGLLPSVNKHYCAAQRGSSSRCKRVTAVATRYRVYAKGASEVVLARCAFAARGGGGEMAIDPLDDARRQQIADEAIAPLAAAAMRTIAVGWKDVDEVIISTVMACDITSSARVRSGGRSSTMSLECHAIDEARRDATHGRSGGRFARVRSFSPLGS